MPSPLCQTIRIFVCLHWKSEKERGRNNERKVERKRKRGRKKERKRKKGREKERKEKI